jgi:hypothetical protein
VTVLALETADAPEPVAASINQVNLTRSTVVELVAGQGGVGRGPVQSWLESNV